MNFLAQFINRYARLIIVLVLVITIFGISQIHNLKVEDDITKYLSENDPEIVFYQEVATNLAIWRKMLPWFLWSIPNCLPWKTCKILN
ncbi:MAG TPA: hypothetical protein PK267_00185 [Atribacterota bacterium]|nr:hypothetical protein [Atribacterota bacterium]